MRRLILVVLALLIAFALAQGVQVDSAGATSQPTASLSLNTRVAILENRLDRMQTQLDDLRTVPATLAKIEDQVTNFSQRAQHQANVVQEVAAVEGLISIIVIVLSFIAGRRSKP